MLKKIAPGFLNRIDTYLLTKHPIIWMSRIHYVLWFGALFYLMSYLLGLLLPINIRSSDDDDGFWYALLSVLSFVLSWFWCYRFLIFNKEKNFGNLNVVDEYKNFFLVFLSISVFIWFAAPFVVSYNNKIANLYSDKELIEDINTLNKVEPYVPTNYNWYENTYDTLKEKTYFNVNKVNTCWSIF